MKNIVLSAVAVLAMSSFAVAGGDIAPVEEPVVVAEPIITDSGVYLGLAYGWMGVDQDFSITNVNYNGQYGTASIDDDRIDYGSVMFQAGYKFNEYIALEGRYWLGLSTDYTSIYNTTTVFSGTVDSWGIYVKPMYPVTDAFDIYALLGYASSTTEENSYAIGNHTTFDPYNANDSADGFSWGLGLAYSFTDSVAIFADYVSLYHDGENYSFVDNAGLAHDLESNTDIQSINIGVTYQF